MEPKENAEFRKRIAAIDTVGNQLLRVLEEADDLEGRAIMPYAFLRKSMRLLAAVTVLVEDDLGEEAQVLVRALIETRINCEYFLSLAQENHAKALARVIDAKMLDKLKALRATDFRLGESKIDEAKWRKIEEEIRGRHTEAELEGLRRHGFAGISLEARAMKIGNKELYDLAYRLYSGHTHATDFHEHTRSRLMPEWDLEDTLVPAVLAIACDCVAAVIRTGNEWMGNPLKAPA
jgi:hypothetical protein